jgi:DNA-binding transcriptional regulator GbsR (MarR family)
MARDDAALAIAIERSAALLTSSGFPRMPARILMALLASESGGLTSAEIADALGISPAAVSGGVRYLQTVGIVHRVATPGSRRDRYELPEDAWFSAVTRKSPLYAALATLAQSAVDAIDEPDSVPSARLSEMAQFYRYLDTRMPQVMDEWEEVRRRQLASDAE